MGLGRATAGGKTGQRGVYKPKPSTSGHAGDARKPVRGQLFLFLLANSASVASVLFGISVELWLRNEKVEKVACDTAFLCVLVFPIRISQFVSAL